MQDKPIKCTCTVPLNTGYWNVTDDKVMDTKKNHSDNLKLHTLDISFFATEQMVVMDFFWLESKFSQV